MRFFYIVAWISVISCAEEETIEKPGQVYPTTATHQVTYDNTALRDPIAVRVLSTRNKPMENVVVQFTVAQGQATLQQETATTDANGVAYSYVTIGENTPFVLVTASVAGFEDVIAFSFDVSRSIATTVEVVSGNNQEAPAGTLLPELLMVMVTDDFGNPAANYPVKFMVTVGEGMVTKETVVTNSEGMASTSMILSTTMPSNEVTAQIPGASTTIKAAGVVATRVEASRTNGTVRVSWQRSVNENFKNYQVVRSSGKFPNTFFSIRTITDKETLQFDDTGLAQGETYFYKVMIESERGTLVDSNVKDIVFGDYINLGTWAEDFQVDDIRKRIYVSVSNENKIYVIDSERKQIIDKILIGSSPRGMALSKDNQSLYVALAGSGDLAMLNLDTKEIKVIDVESAVGSSSVFHVVEAAPNRVFVTGQTGFNYLTMVKIDEGIAVRVSDIIMRDYATLSVEYGKYLYVNEGKRLYKFDVSTDTPWIVLGKTFSTVISYHIISPDGKKIFLRSGQQLNAANLGVEHTYDGSVSYAISSTGGILYDVESFYMSGYNTTSHERVTFFPIACREVVSLKVSNDSKNLYVLSRDFYNFWLYFLEAQ